MRVPFFFSLLVLLITYCNCGHTNNWAVLVGTSRFWFNYRHIANVLSLYRSVKRLGIPDSQIILMLPDDMACNPRNRYPAEIFNNRNRKTNIYGDNVEVDYRGYDVSVESFVRLLTGRTKPDTPHSKKLMTDENSNILVYMSGHGGEEFLKFQDAEEITSIELADAFEQMRQKKRYNEILFIVDTCQANTLYKKFYSKGILASGSSAKGESSWSHHDDPEIGISVIDRYTHDLLEELEKQDGASRMSMKKLFSIFQYNRLLSNAGFLTDLFDRPLNKVPITDFFGQKIKVKATKIAINNIQATRLKSSTRNHKVNLDQNHQQRQPKKSGDRKHFMKNIEKLVEWDREKNANLMGAEFTILYTSCVGVLSVLLLIVIVK